VHQVGNYCIDIQYVCREHYSSCTKHCARTLHQILVLLQTGATMRNSSSSYSDSAFIPNQEYIKPLNQPKFHT